MKSLYETEISFPAGSGITTSYGKARATDDRLTVSMKGFGVLSKAGLANVDVSIPAEIGKRLKKPSDKTTFLTAVQNPWYTGAGSLAFYPTVISKESDTKLTITFWTTPADGTVVTGLVIEFSVSLV